MHSETLQKLFTALGEDFLAGLAHVFSGPETPKTVEELVIGLMHYLLDRIIVEKLTAQNEPEKTGLKSWRGKKA